LYWHLPHYHHSTPGSSIRVGDWKLIEFFEDGSIELYDLGEDVSEQNNLAAAHPEIAARLKRQLTQWRQNVGAQMPVPNPNYDETRAGELRKPAKSATRE